MSYSDTRFGGYPATPQLEPRTELRNPDLAHMPLGGVGGVIDALTTLESIDAQVDEYTGLAGGDYNSPAFETAEAMLGARRQRAELFIGSRGNPEIDVVRRRLEDAPGSRASTFDYNVLSRVPAPGRGILVRDARIEVRPTDFALPGDFLDAEYQEGVAQLAELQRTGEEPWVKATALVAPDGSVTYVHRDGNLKLAAIASMVGRKVPLREVEIYAADPAVVIEAVREETSPTVAPATEEAPTEVNSIHDDHPTADSWMGVKRPSTRNGHQSSRHTEDEPGRQPITTWIAFF